MFHLDMLKPNTTFHLKLVTQHFTSTSTVLLHQKLPDSAAPQLTGVILFIEPKPFSALTYNDHHNLLSLSPCTVGKYRQRFSHGYLVFYIQTACLQLAWLLVFPEYWSIYLSNLFGVQYLYDKLKGWASRQKCTLSRAFIHIFRKI